MKKTLFAQHYSLQLNTLLHHFKFHRSSISQSSTFSDQQTCRILVSDLVSTLQFGPPSNSTNPIHAITCLTLWGVWWHGAETVIWDQTRLSVDLHVWKADLVRSAMTWSRDCDLRSETSLCRPVRVKGWHGGLSSNMSALKLSNCSTVNLCQHTHHTVCCQHR